MEQKVGGHRAPYIDKHAYLFQYFGAEDAPNTAQAGRLCHQVELFEAEIESVSRSSGGHSAQTGAKQSQEQEQAGVPVKDGHG
jgi:hypothetical protein